VLTGGDLIMDALGQSQGRADSLFTLYTTLQNEFNMPVYNTMGNHEVFGLYEKSGISPQHEEYGRGMYLKYMNYDQSYYSFDHNGWHFIVLDGIGFTPERRYYGHIDSLQIEWLENDLHSVDTKTPIVITTHIPFVSVYGQFVNGATHALSGGEVIVNAHDVLKKFEHHNLKLVLQGHLHEVEHIEFKGTHFITGGAVCAEWWKGPRDGFPEGFVVIDTKRGEFEWRYETFGWESRFVEND
jgi:3',5'-cyclic AMP phosphodiesterase CpdA